MESSVYQQVVEYINRAGKILIVLPEHLSVDHLGSAVALRTVLVGLGKDVVLACSATELPNVNFISTSQVQKNFGGTQGLIIDVAGTHAQLDELSYEAQGISVRIFLKAKDGQFAPEDVSVSSSAGSFDLVITLGLATLEDLGQLYHQNTAVFFDTPKINIDTQAGNEYFGAINLVEANTAALSEVVAQIISLLDPDFSDEAAATALLGGILSSTHSFQDPATTPKTLITASNLIAHGGRQQDIIQALFKTKEFSLLKLWGRALARIKTLPDNSLLYSALTRADFEKTGQSVERMPDVMREILDNVSGFPVVALLGETEHGVRVLLTGLPHADLVAMAGKFTEQHVVSAPLAGLYQSVSFDLEDVDMAEAEEKLVVAAKK